MSVEGFEKTATSLPGSPPLLTVRSVYRVSGENSRTSELASAEKERDFEPISPQGAAQEARRRAKRAASANGARMQPLCGGAWRSLAATARLITFTSSALDSLSTLHEPELVVDAAGGDEFVVRAAFGEVAVVEDENLVGVADCREAVGYHDYSATRGYAVH